MSLARRLIVVLAAVPALAALAFGGLSLLAWREQAVIRDAMPPGWASLLRARAAVPADAEALAPARTLDLDGAPVLWDSLDGTWRRFRTDSAYARLAEGRQRPADAVLWDELESDVALAAWVRAARASRWDGVGQALAHSDSAARRDVFRLRAPRYIEPIRVAQALEARARIRAAAGRRADAEADLRAAIGIGQRLLTAEPALNGFVAGRFVLHAGAAGLARLARAAGDTALARRAQALADWSEASTADDYGILAAAADSALAFAADPALALGWRVTAMGAVVTGRYQSPRAQLFGLPSAVEAALLAAGGPDTSAAGRMAAIAAATIRSADAAGLGARRRMARQGVSAPRLL